LKTVLVVDDKESTREAVCECLGGDYSTIEACNGEEAITILGETSDISLVVLDIEMPVTNGWETLRVIRDEDGWPDMPVIMLTVHDEPECVLKAWGLGVNYYVTKPFSPITLLELTHKAIKETVND